MADPTTLLPICLQIREDPHTTLQILKNLAGSSRALRQGVKTLSVYINVGGHHVGFDLREDFLQVYPNLRELELIGFDYLVGCTPEFEIDLRHTNGPGAADDKFSLRTLTLEAFRTEPHSIRMLFEQTRQTPHLSELQLANIAFQPGSNPVAPPRLSYALDEYSFVSEQVAEGRGSCRGWSAPFASESFARGTRPPKSLSICLLDRRDFDELKGPDVDLSSVRGLFLNASRLSSALSLTDYGVLVSRCTRLRDLYISTDQSAAVEGLFSLLSELTGPLRTLAVVAFQPDSTAVVRAAADKTFVDALELPQLRRLRRFDVALMDSSGSEVLSHQFPLFSASCRARRFRLL